MTTGITLTDKQQDVLHSAATRFFGNTLPAAAHLGIRGGAYAAVTRKLKEAGLLDGEEGNLTLTDAAYALLGIERMGYRPEQQEQSAEAPAEPLASSQEVATQQDDVPPKTRKLRSGTKQAQVIEMLQRAEGATLAQIMEATGWQMHTTRSVLSRTIQKDLQMPLCSEKSAGGERVYRLAAE